MKSGFKIILLIFLLIFFSCKDTRRVDKLEEKDIEIKEIVTTETVEVEQEIDQPLIETFIDVQTLYPEFTAVEKKDANLDYDSAIEQFIILVDQLNLVTIVVADFNKITREYFVAWEQRLPFVYNSDFLMTEQDVLAVQQQLQLVISGTTINNQNGLFIFQKTAPPKGIHIYYKSIFAAESAGTVQLAPNQRGLNYLEGKKEIDKAHDIQIVKSNFTNENTINIITENWAWDRRHNKFIKASSKSVEEKVNTQETLRTVYMGSKQNYIDFLDGEWYLNMENDKSRMILIDSKNNRITLLDSEGQEYYEIVKNKSWKNYQKINLKLENIDVNSITKLFYITLNSTDKFTITSTTKNPTPEAGVYQRVNNEFKDNMISITNLQVIKEVPFTGIFTNVSYSINFLYPEYSIIHPEKGTIESGVFSLLELNDGQMVIQLNSSDESRINNTIKNYKITYEEQKLESQIIRTLKMHEGTLTTYGIEAVPDIDPIRFEQTEVISGE